MFVFIYNIFIFFFFFSSRRRHTRWNCDWSSDVCSSDLSTSRATARPTMPAPMTAKSWCPPAGPGPSGGRESLQVIRSVGHQRADGRGDAVHGGDDLLLEHVGERQRDAGRGDPADGGIQQLESLIGDDGGDGAA